MKRAYVFPFPLILKPQDALNLSNINKKVTATIYSCGVHIKIGCVWWKKKEDGDFGLYTTSTIIKLNQQLTRCYYSTPLLN